MKQFKNFGIKVTNTNLIGDKIKISKILNKEIIVEDFRIGESKYGEGKKYLSIQFLIGECRQVVFTGSVALMEAIQQVNKNDFPFSTTIVREDERLEFT